MTGGRRCARGMMGVRRQGQGDDQVRLTMTVMAMMGDG